MMYIDGIDPIKLMEGLMNVLVAKGVLTKAEAQAVVLNAAHPEAKKQLFKKFEQQSKEEEGIIDVFEVEQ